MSYENWKDKVQGFQTMDVRHIQGSFFEGLKKRAEALEMGEGLHIIQTFEPHPLYAVMEGLGYEHHTEQRGEAEFDTPFAMYEALAEYYEYASNVKTGSKYAKRNDEN